jgi:Zn-dependent protease with chaperone function
MRTLRAAVAVALLAGFYLLALGLVVALIGGGVWVVVGGHGIGVKLVLFGGVVAFAVLRALYVVGRSAPERDESGLPLTPEAQPALWQEVRALAVAAGTRPPDEILLVPVVNAAVSEQASLLGLRAGRRTMYIGAPLLVGLTADQLRSVLAHELGHYSGSHTRLGVITYRGMEQLAHVVEQLEDHFVLGAVFRGYRRLYLAVALAVSRRQEFEADAVSARLVGPDTAAAALRELAVIEAGWTFYQRNYVGWAVGSGVRPAEFFGGLRRLLGDPGRAESLAKIRDDEQDEKAGWADSHPPISRRVAALMTFPQIERVPDDRSAVVLLADGEATLRALAQHVLIDDVLALPELSWDEVPTVAGPATVRGAAVALQQAADQVHGSPATLADVLGLFDAGAAGHLGELATERKWPRTAAEAGEAAGQALAALVATFAVGAGSLSWRLSWSGPVLLVDSSGAEVALDRAVELAIGGDTGEARALLTRLGLPSDARLEQTATPA